MITGRPVDLLKANQGQERQGGEDKYVDGRTTSMMHMWTQLGRDWCRVDADGFDTRAALDSGWNSQQGKASINFFCSTILRHIGRSPGENGPQ